MLHDWVIAITEQFINEPAVSRTRTARGFSEQALSGVCCSAQITFESLVIPAAHFPVYRC